MRGQNKTYKPGPNTELLRNVNSVDPQYDGWWLHGPTERHFNRRPRRISQNQAMKILRTTHQLGTLEVL